MNVLMLGWEYPPHIAGGLGVACEGLTRAMAEHNIHINFVVPKLLGGENAGHMSLSDSFHTLPNSQPLQTIEKVGVEKSKIYKGEVQKSDVGIALLPYDTPSEKESRSVFVDQLSDIMSGKLYSFQNYFLQDEELSEISHSSKYGKNMFEEVIRYTARVIKRYSECDFDVIHVHDWMTYPAGMALQQLSKKPLVAHVHSLDYDRSGPSRNHEISHIEYSGVHAADAVIAVSEYTKNILFQEYNVPLSKISVVHNGVQENNRAKARAPKTQDSLKLKSKSGKSVLFLGRVTVQKGPDYFLRAIQKVVKHIPETTFIMAGTGDMLPGMIEMAHSLGIQDQVHFTGFLAGKEVEEAFEHADLYVLPSVSEPFGISALEAINFDTPVLMSKQSGVSEVINHTLKFDFWDVDRLANLIINALLHDELRLDMVELAKKELEVLRWEAAASRTELVYQSVVQSHELCAS